MKPNNLRKLRDTILKSKTEPQFTHRLDIFKRIVNYIEMSNNETQLHGFLLEDFDAFSSWYLKNAEGLPIFPAIWQSQLSKQLDGQKRKVICFAARHAGKSTLFSAKILHKAIKDGPWRISCFAPTRGQDFVFNNIRKMFHSDNFLEVNYMKSDTAERIVLQNGSEIINHTIGLQTKGELARGEYGSVFLDEIELIEEYTLNSVLFPIVSDAYAENFFWSIGTPNLRSNAKLETMWENWKGSDNWVTYHVDWRRAVQEGCIPFQEVDEAMFRDMTPDEFDMEYNAIFPKQMGRFFPRDVLIMSGYRDVSMHDELSKGQPGRQYVMSVDFAKVHDRTEILVGEILDDHLHYIFWKRIDPKDRVMNWDDQFTIIRDIYKRYLPWQVILDTTTFQEKFIDDLTNPRSGEGIPESVLWINHKDEIGYRATAEMNHFMWQNHRQKIVSGKIHVPVSSPYNPNFFDEWVKQHNELNIKRVGSTKDFISLEPPKNGFKDLAVASAMLSMLISGNVKASAAFDVVGWRKG